MTQTTPAPERYRRFSCPNPACASFQRCGEGNRVHRAWTGTHQPIERLRCTAGGRAGSEREGTLVARSNLPADPGVRLLKGQRWGVGEAGTAARCAVALKTVPRLQPVAAPRAESHHRQGGREVDGPGVPLEEAHANLRPPQVAWLHTAVARGRGVLLGVDSGPRTQEQAAAVVAPGVARVREVPIVLTAGWKASSGAWLQGLGGVSRRRRRGTVGRKPPPRLVAPQPLFYAPVVKVRNTPGQGVEGRRRVGCGGPRRLGQQGRRRERGPTIQTACRARW